jgi:hypothetical protein
VLNWIQRWDARTRTVRSPAVVLLAFLLALVVSLAGLVFATVRGIAAWRQAKQTGRTVSAELAALNTASLQAQVHLENFERSNLQLQQSLERLRVSRAQLQVLLDALERAQARLRWLRVFLPR